MVSTEIVREKTIYSQLVTKNASAKMIALAETTDNWPNIVT